MELIFLAGLVLMGFALLFVGLYQMTVNSIKKG